MQLLPALSCKKQAKASSVLARLSQRRCLEPTSQPPRRAATHSGVETGEWEGGREGGRLRERENRRGAASVSQWSPPADRPGPASAFAVLLWTRLYPPISAVLFHFFRTDGEKIQGQLVKLSFKLSSSFVLFIAPSSLYNQFLELSEIKYFKVT
jgi:hypothetical protein